MDAASRRPKRAVYQSPLREEQAQRTGERILEALAEHLAEQGWETFSIARVAERAGVSEPTVYRHFPNREAMLDAFSVWHEERVFFPGPPPESLDELPVFAHALYEHFQTKAGIVRAMVRAAVGREVRARGRDKRDRRARSLAGEVFDHRAPDEARAAAAVLRMMISGDAWDEMTGRLGVAPPAASAAVAWAAQALIDAARRDRKNGRRTLLAPETLAASAAMSERARRRRDAKKGT